MVRGPSKQLTAQVLLVLYAVRLVFHILILVDLVPSTLVWGWSVLQTGEVSSIALEGVAIGVLIIAALATALHANLVPGCKAPPDNHSEVLSCRYQMTRGILVFLALYFAFNALGNLLSNTALEKSMAIITVTLSGLSAQLVLLTRRPTRAVAKDRKDYTVIP